MILAKIMKILIYVTLTVQFCCFAAGVYFLCQGSLFYGWFNIILNAIFIPLNINNLKRLDLIIINIKQLRILE